MKNEIKKALYKQKPKADYLGIEGDNYIFRTTLEFDVRIDVHFFIPVGEKTDDMKGGIDAHLLIRWMV